MLHHVIEAMVDAVLVVDVEGRISLANTGAGQLTGYTVDELRSLPISEVLDDDSSGLRTLVRRRIESGTVWRREESWLVTREGERIPVSVTGSAVFDGRTLHGIVLVARDIRDIRRLLAEREAEIARRTRAEAELRELNASIERQLEQTRESLLLAERRATLGTLAGGVGHELRNIAQIQVATVDEIEQAIATGEDLAAIVRSVLPDLARVGAHITAHGNRLMQLARPGSDYVQPLDLIGVVRDVVAMLRGAGKLRRVQVVERLAPSPLTVTVNRTRIEQILVNLIVNAVDAIGGARGTITIDVHAAPDRERVICAVQDTGTGVAEGDLERIFEPFFTTKPDDRGTGLGLSVAREIVESYGGVLRVNSRVGSGTTFTFDLPA